MTAITNEIECGILNEALTLAHSTRRLRIVAVKQFSLAKELFKTARERAIEAFWNENLNLKERIMACKLGRVARILECLENPDSAIASCLLSLEELHGLSAVRETLYLNGGLKSMLNKAERLENVKSVMLTNFMIFEFTRNLGCKLQTCNAGRLFSFPTVSFTQHVVGTRFVNRRHCIKLSLH